MAIPLLTIKLHIPPLRPKRVLRQRLIERLKAGLDRKTTLISEWLSEPQWPCARLSLDQEGNGPAGFFTYLVTMLQTVNSNVGQAAQEMLQAAQPADVLMTAVSNNLSAVEAPFVLVLEDCHHITDASVRGAMALLIDPLLADVHLANIEESATIRPGMLSASYSPPSEMGVR